MYCCFSSDNEQQMNANIWPHLFETFDFVQQSIDEAPAPKNN
jgi:hypothetical protein